MNTHPAFMPTGIATHHSMQSRVEAPRLALENEIRTDLLSFSSKDRRIQQLRKDIQQHRNKCVETIAAILTDPTSDRPVAERGRLGKRIWDFFCAHLPTGHRSFGQVNCVETKKESDLNEIQMAIAHGDVSNPMLDKGIETIDDYIPVLLELRAAFVQKRYSAGGAR